MADTDTDSEGSDIISHDGDVDDADWPCRYIACDDQDDDDDNHDIYDREDEFDGYHDGWTTDQFRRRNVRQFTREKVGSSVQHPKEVRPKHYFDLMWGDDLWERIVTETNRYADQVLNREPVWDDFGLRWTTVDVPTMKAFIDLCFCGGILRLPGRNGYWRVRKRLFRTNFSKVMPRDRFNLIWRYFHLQDNESQPVAGDKFHKIRWFLDYLNRKFAEAYTPYGNYTVDESMIKFKGRLSFR